MKIVTLMENSQGSCSCLCEHGLSVYIEANGRKILLDTGAGEGFIKNAEIKGVDLRQVDTVVISHGHYDHTGGLLEFFKINSKAKIYIHKEAVGDFFVVSPAETRYIGMDKKITNLENVIFLDDNCELGDGISIFSGVKGRHAWPRGNKVLKKKTDDGYVQDEFEHEQNLVINECDKRVLLSGCAHNGILNILDEYRRIYKNEPTHVIGGFHTMKAEFTAEDDEIIEQTGRELAKLDTVFYSGHCTGEYPMKKLRELMGDKLVALYSGCEIF